MEILIIGVLAGKVYFQERSKQAIVAADGSPPCNIHGRYSGVDDLGGVVRQHVCSFRLVLDVP